MVYEAEKAKMYSLLTSELGFSRTVDGALERESEERALEARQQTGLGPPYPLIVHGTPASRISRLGVTAPPYLTPEIATWNLQFRDPVTAAGYGWLNSSSHRAVLDNRTYDFWGLGIYTELPGGEPELNRRWYFIMWLSNEPIAASTPAQPQTIISPPKLVRFSAGHHWGYRFGSNGSIIDKKALTLTSSSPALADGRSRINNRTGDWLRMSNGYFEGFWVKEQGFLALQDESELA